MLNDIVEEAVLDNLFFRYENIHSHVNSRTMCSFQFLKYGKSLNRKRVIIRLTVQVLPEGGYLSLF